MPSLVDECLLGKNKFKNFLEVVEDCGIKTGYDFIHFMSVTKEHCIDKGITDYDEVKKIWEEHKESIKQIIENSKKSNIIGVFTDKDGNKTPIMKMAGLFPEDIDKYPDDLYYKDKDFLGKLYADKETYEWLTTPSEEDDDVGYWQPDQVTELDDEAYNNFEKEVMNSEPDMEKVEAAKKIFKDVDKVINDIKIVEIPVNAKTNPLKNQEEFNDLWKYERTHYGEPHLLELMDEWGVNGSNYADFRSVIQEHCFDKGLYAFDDIEKTWKEHQESIKNAGKGFDKVEVKKENIDD